MIDRRLIAGAALAALVAGSGSARAEGPYAPIGYAPGYAEGYGYGGYGFADEAVRGAYVGAPGTRFPRPSEIVPAPWSYGTYGVPTISGIRPAPVGQPTLTVIHGQGARPGRRGPRVLSREEAGLDPSPGAARVIEVTVPRR